LCVAFLLAGERDLVWLMAGALASGLLGVGLLALLGRYSRVKEDAAVGVVLSVFFGAGTAMLGLIQRRASPGGQGGLESYILGRAVGLRLADVVVLAALAAGCLLAVALLYKELKLVSFDRDFASTQGWPAAALDFLALALVAVVVVAGLPTVGVVLVAAMLIVPGAAARFWTDRLGVMLVLSSIFGVTTGVLGALLSARYDRLPAGPLIVLVGAAIFLVSALAAPTRGVVARWIESRRPLEAPPE